MNHQKNIFGVIPSKKPTKRQLEKEAQITVLLEDMYREYELRDLMLFRAAAEAEYYKFLRNVRGCPEFVLKFCQEKLAPDALTKYRAHKK